MSNAEIGQIMGRSEGAVKSLYHRTLLVMRDELNGLLLDLEQVENDNGGKEGHVADCNG